MYSCAIPRFDYTEVLTPFRSAQRNYRRTTVSDRQDEPALLNALIVMLLVPLINGTEIDQSVVPLAVPLPPAELVQVTDVLPLDPVPLIAIASHHVAIIVN